MSPLCCCRVTILNLLPLIFFEQTCPPRSMKPPPPATHILGLCAIWTPLCLVMSAVMAPLGVAIAPESIPPLQLPSEHSVSTAVQLPRSSRSLLLFQTITTVRKVSAPQSQDFNFLRRPHILVSQDTPPDRGSPGRSQGAGSRYRTQPPPSILGTPESCLG